MRRGDAYVSSDDYDIRDIEHQVELRRHADAEKRVSETQMTQHMVPSLAYDTMTTQSLGLCAGYSKFLYVLSAADTFLSLVGLGGFVILKGKTTNSG